MGRRGGRPSQGKRAAFGGQLGDLPLPALRIPPMSLPSSFVLVLVLVLDKSLFKSGDGGNDRKKTGGKSNPIDSHNALRGRARRRGRGRFGCGLGREVSRTFSPRCENAPLLLRRPLQNQCGIRITGRQDNAGFLEELARYGDRRSPHQL